MSFISNPIPSIVTPTGAESLQDTLLIGDITGVSSGIYFSDGDGANFASSSPIQWSSTTNPFGNKDVFISRGAVGRLNLGTTPGAQDGTLTLSAVLGDSAGSLTIQPNSGQVTIHRGGGGTLAFQVDEGGILFSDNRPVRIGGSSDAIFEWDTGQVTANALLLALKTSRNFILIDNANLTKDHDHAASTNPTLFIHSAEDPDGNNAQWTSLSHDQTNAVLGVGSGSLSLGAAIFWPSGLGAVNHLVGPADQNLILKPGNTALRELILRDRLGSDIFRIFENAAQFDGSNGLRLSSPPGGLRLFDDVGLHCGDAIDASLFWSTGQAVESLLLAIKTPRLLIITDDFNKAKDHDHAASTNPTLFIHSAGDPDVNNAQWVSLSHDQSDAQLSIGSGNLVIDAPLLVPDGTVGAPSVAFSSDADGTGTGFYRPTTNQIGMAVNGVGAITLTTSSWFSSNSTIGPYGTRTLVSEQASTPLALNQTTHNNRVFTNEGASAEIVFDLPTILPGCRYTFVVQDANGIQINAATGDTIRIAGSVSAAAGLIESAVIGNTITLVAINATEWIATAVNGVWTVT